VSIAFDVEYLLFSFTLLTTLFLDISVLFYCYLPTVFLWNLFAHFFRHLFALKLLRSPAFLLRQLCAVFNIFAIFLGNVLAACGVMGCAQFLGILFAVFCVRGLTVLLRDLFAFLVILSLALLFGNIFAIFFVLCGTFLFVSTLLFRHGLTGLAIVVRRLTFLFINGLAFLHILAVFYGCFRTNSLVDSFAFFSWNIFALAVVGGFA